VEEKFLSDQDGFFLWFLLVAMASSSGKNVLKKFKIAAAIKNTHKAQRSFQYSSSLAADERPILHNILKNKT
jgi:hypothetical protein